MLEKKRWEYAAYKRNDESVTTEARKMTTRNERCAKSKREANQSLLTVVSEWARRG